MGWWSRLFGGGSPPARSEHPPTIPRGPRPRRFAAERDRMFDLDRTAALAALLDTPPDARDRAWREDFHVAAWYGSLELASPEPFRGPDGFPYLRLQVPRPGAFESQSLGNLAAGCVEGGVGAAIFASPDAADDEAAFVFSMGALDGLIRFDDIDGDPADQGAPAASDGVFEVERIAGGQRLTVRTGHQALVGAPSRDLLPPSTARPLLRHLTDGWGMVDPGVALMVDASMTPSRTLVVGRKRGDFAPSDPVDAIVRMLLWYLPPGSMVMLMPDEWSDRDLTPLRDYAA